MYYLIPVERESNWIPPPTFRWLVDLYFRGYNLYKLEILRNDHDFCILLQIAPRLLYHPYEDVLGYWDPESESLVRHKRELGITLAVILGLGLGAAGAATGTSAIALQYKAYRN